MDTEDIERAAGLEVERHTRPAQLVVVGRRVLLEKTQRRRLADMLMIACVLVTAIWMMPFGVLAYEFSPRW